MKLHVWIYNLHRNAVNKKVDYGPDISNEEFVRMGTNVYHPEYSDK